MADYSLLNDPDMKEIFESFLIETREILEKLDLELVKLETQPDDKDLLNEIFRAFHTIKGTSGFLGLVRLQTITHKLEDILNKLRKGDATLNDEIADGILKGYDSISELLDVVETQKNEDYDNEEVTQILQAIIDDLNNAKAETSAEKVETKVQKEPAEKKTKTRKNNANKKEVVTVSENEAEVATAVVEKEEKVDQVESGEKQTANVQDEKTIETVEVKKVESPKISTAAKTQSAKTVEQTIRVDVDRLDDLLNIISELVLGRNRLMQINMETSHEYEGTKIAHDLADTTRQIDLMTTELQLAVMKTRMIKIGKVFNRFPRLVRDLSKETGKEIQLIIRGEDTELDKTLIEEINDPLVHLIRNSVDHGIENPETREEIGKNRKGAIILSAEHEGNDIIITIEDDGKGIDPEVIKKKAAEKGIISAEKAKELSKQETFSLIFAPGFSTAEKVTNVSGRGVGMDVVKTNVTKLHGIINVESAVGEGTKIIIKLPLTLAIIQGLLVEIAGETIVIPLSSVIEVIRVSKKEIYMVNQTECIKVRDSVLPLCDIDTLLYRVDSSLKNNNWQHVVVVGIAEKRVGIKVDNLIGQKEIVIKSLGKYLGNLDGIAGSTIMGDGKVVMIVDIAELVNKLME
ncbi:chemotaxis protein CheA [bacterium BMS3Abin04]|nr:chemotaxis protein CheA [bacterium BMS3Abin04]